jgi:hypothetical protein
MQEAGDDDDEGAAAVAAADGAADQVVAHFTGWPFQDEEDYETSDSDEFSDGDEDAGVEAADATGAAGAGGYESIVEALSERRRAMPPMDKMGKEAGGDEGKCNVVLCACLEGHTRVRQLLALVHAITQADDGCMLANACWDVAVPEAIPPQSLALPSDGAVTDDAAVAQLPVHCVHALLMHGASPDHCGRDGQTALEASVMCKNVAATAALCAFGADASVFASQEQLNGVALAADSKDSRASKIQELLKQQSATGKGSAVEAAKAKSRSAWLRLAARICWVHNPQAAPVQRNRDASEAPDAALAMPVVQSYLAQELKPPADLNRVSALFLCLDIVFF